MAVQLLAGYWDFNLATGELSLCPRSRQMFGFEEPAAATLPRAEWEPRLHPGDIPVIARAFEVAARRNAIYSARFRTILPDGSLRQILGIGRLASGDPERFVGLNVDVAVAAAAASREQGAGRDTVVRACRFRPANENGAWASRLRFRTRASDPAARAGANGRPARDVLMQRAEALMRLRELRKRFLNPAMLGEPAFDLLLLLYVTRGSRPSLSVEGLSLLIGMPESTTGRWLRFLVDEGLVLIAGGDRGAPAVASAALTGKGRAALDAYLGVFDLVQ